MGGVGERAGRGTGNLCLIGSVLFGFMTWESKLPQISSTQFVHRPILCIGRFHGNSIFHIERRYIWDIWLTVPLLTDKMFSAFLKPPQIPLLQCMLTRHTYSES